MNEQIRAQEVLVLDENRKRLGIMSVPDAIVIAEESGLDLLEIAPDARPPVTMIMDYGRYQYEKKKREKETKIQTSEVKNVQVKPGTGDNDILVKAKRSAKWLSEGHRVRVELYLRGRSKYMDKEFLRERIDRFLHHLPVPYKIVDDVKKTPKGIAILVEFDKTKKQESNIEKEKKD